MITINNLILFVFNRNTAEIFPMISSNLADFPKLLENMTWIRNFPMADGQLVSLTLDYLQSPLFFIRFVLKGNVMKGQQCTIVLKEMMTAGGGY